MEAAAAIVRKEQCCESEAEDWKEGSSQCHVHSANAKTAIPCCQGLGSWTLKEEGEQ